MDDGGGAPSGREWWWCTVDDCEEPGGHFGPQVSANSAAIDAGLTRDDSRDSGELSGGGVLAAHE